MRLLLCYYLFRLEDVVIKAGKGFILQLQITVIPLVMISLEVRCVTLNDPYYDWYCKWSRKNWFNAL